MTTTTGQGKNNASSNNMDGHVESHSYSSLLPSTTLNPAPKVNNNTSEQSLKTSIDVLNGNSSHLVAVSSDKSFIENRKENNTATTTQTSESSSETDQKFAKRWLDIRKKLEFHYPPKIVSTSYVVFERISNRHSKASSSSSESFKLIIHYFKGPKLTHGKAFDERQLTPLTLKPQVIHCSSRHSVTSMQGLLLNHFDVNVHKYSIYIKIEGCSEYHMLYCQKGKTENVRSLILVQENSSQQYLTISTRCLCLNTLSDLIVKPLEHILPTQSEVTNSNTSSSSSKN
ncbi:hypothetical protein FDP41_011947 [Naegleria fowleri]|uniref:Uncharacterized protein n=1 Tax=Naegleria fowleri TaxID=5763 RepID=A0A6A5C2Z3_NAEFO|nr:uncharacterized protein FDP41_011947 [Naegleria fowleri]KAF0982086.1 hypothetical protein FDP41_011947 [Naegleria fowleri]